jgi:hypothetical protein
VTRLGFGLVCIGFWHGLGGGGGEGWGRTGMAELAVLRIRISWRRIRSRPLGGNKPDPVSDPTFGENWIRIRAVFSLKFCNKIIFVLKWPTRLILLS